MLDEALSPKRRFRGGTCRRPAHHDRLRPQASDNSSSGKDEKSGTLRVRLFREVGTSDTSRSTLPMALLVFRRPDEPDRDGVTAASTVMTIPVLIFLVLVQRRLVSGLGGAVKD